MKIFNYFSEKTSSKMFDRVLNESLMGGEQYVILKKL